MAGKLLVDLFAAAPMFPARLRVHHNLLKWIPDGKEAYSCCDHPHTLLVYRMDDQTIILLHNIECVTYCWSNIKFIAFELLQGGRSVFLLSFLGNFFNHNEWKNNLLLTIGYLLFFLGMILEKEKCAFSCHTHMTTSYCDWSAMDNSRYFIIRMVELRSDIQPFREVGGDSFPYISLENCTLLLFMHLIASNIKQSWHLTGSQY